MRPTNAILILFVLAGSTIATAQVPAGSGQPNTPANASAASWPAGSPEAAIDPAKRAVIEQLPAGVMPLYVLGDVNEDGAFDTKDLESMRRMAAGDTPAEATCPAAADLNFDGVVNAADVQIAEQLLRTGPITEPALHATFRLPCQFKHFFVAARQASMPGGVMPIQFLDKQFTTKNSTVTVTDGPATVTPMPGGGGYNVSIAKSAAVGTMVTVRIALAGGRNYFYSFSIDEAAVD